MVIEVSGGSVRTRLGAGRVTRNLVLAGEPQLIMALLSGHRTVAEAADLGLEISGDDSVLLRVLPGLASFSAFPTPAPGNQP